MNSGETDLRRLLEAYFDGGLAADEKTALEARLSHDPEARKLYWEMAQWHAAFMTWGSQQAGQKLATFAPTEGVGDRTADAGGRVWHFPRWIMMTLAAAAAVILIWTAAVERGLFTPRRGAPVAELAFQRQARWAPGAPLQGTTLRAGRYRLERGVVSFDTAAGAVVTVAAPADFTFSAPDRMALASGRMTARMLRHGSSRLTVNVRGVEVRDLGTAFGIDARASSHALVSVFNGLVAVTGATQAGARTLVAEGQSVIADPDRSVRPTAYAPEAFNDLWPLTVGINESSQLVKYLPPGPLLRPLRDYEANRRVFLFPERQGVVSRHPLPVDISPAAPNWPNSPVTPYPLGAGRRVNSYLVFYQPNAVSRGAPPRRLSGEIVFRHRVLGIICSDQWLDATDAVLGFPGAHYATPHQHRGLEEADKDNYRGTRLRHDSVSIAPDGRTVHFDFYVSDEREQLRIIVAAE